MNATDGLALITRLSTSPGPTSASAEMTAVGPPCLSMKFRTAAGVSRNGSESTPPSIPRGGQPAVGTSTRRATCGTSSAHDAKNYYLIISTADTCASMFSL